MRLSTLLTLLKTHPTEGLADGRGAPFVPPVLWPSQALGRTGWWSVMCPWAGATNDGQRWNVTPEPRLLTTPAQERAGSEGLRSEMQPVPFLFVTTTNTSILQ